MSPRLNHAERLLLPCLCLALFHAGGPAATAATAIKTGPADPPVSIGARAWITTGYSTWTANGLVDPTLGFESKLEWESLDSTMPLLHAAWTPVRGIRLSAAWGSAGFNGGDNTDTDWLFDPSDPANRFTLSESVSRTEGDTDLGQVDLTFDVAGLSPVHGPFRLEVLVGYQWYNEHVEDSDGVQTIINEEPVYQPFHGRNASFDFSWNAFRAGAGVSYDFSREFRVGSELIALLDVSQEGEGFWNLRQDFRSTSPNIANDADGGFGYDLSATVSWMPKPWLRVDAGWRALFLEAGDGTYTVYFSDGTKGEGYLDTVESARQGFFAGASLRF